MLTVETQGIHPSTASCLEALGWLREQTDCTKILEIGCGNGILSAVAASLWGGHVIAADISEKALEDSKNNLAQQGLLDQVTLIRSDGFSHPAIAKHAPYDLIIGNLLAELQADFSRHIKKCLAPGGYLLLSGILRWKIDDILLIYNSLGFAPQHRISCSPWETVIFRHTIVT